MQVCETNFVRESSNEAIIIIIIIITIIIMIIYLFSGIRQSLFTPID